MKEGIFELSRQTRLTENMYKMTLSGDVSEIKRPGQFVNIKLDGFYLRRPISVADCGEDNFDIIYKSVGAGTTYMSTLLPGAKLNILTGLGNGYDTSKSGDRPLLVGGGAGVPPLYLLTKELIKKGASPTVVIGFNKADEIYYAEEFEHAGARVIVTTADGSAGVHGFVTAALPLCGEFTHVYACGPEPMLKSVYDSTSCGGQYSFEERMGCGFGACMGCTCKTKYGAKRICKEGPVLTREEIIW
mgnify:FL=1